MTDTLNRKDIVPMMIEDEMKRSYLDYAMSVIVSRALPDVRDGLKPVHRRILFSMYETGYFHNKPYRKSARVVGDVIGKYHPHGDQAVYDALVRLAQEFAMSSILVDGQGNFGSVDGDSAAAMRYTEVKLTKLAGLLLDDLNKDTVAFQPNYDGQEKEPVVVPARFPNLLVNGTGGIAVGMATSIPPHNLGEVIDGCVALIDNPDASLSDIMALIPAPDFPTGGQILGQGGARHAYATGRGSIMLRGKAEIKPFGKDRQSIIITEIPYQVNKASMVEKIAELVRDKKLEGISDLRDESDREGIRVVIELKRDGNPDVLLNQLYRHTPLQVSVSPNMLVLNGGRPEQMGLIGLLKAFNAFREEVTIKRIRFDLTKARDKAHVLVGLAAAVANVDEIVRLVRGASDPATARRLLMERIWNATAVESYIRLIDDPMHPMGENGTYTLSEKQAQAILDLRLQRLTALGVDEIASELKDLSVSIEHFLDLLGHRHKILSLIKEDLLSIKDEFAVPRRTEILESEIDLEDEDLIVPEEMVILVTNEGYIQRVPQGTYRTQKRGGKGRMAMNTRGEDFMTQLFVANMLTPVLFFSNKGIAYQRKVWRLPAGTPQSRGKLISHILPIIDGEAITSVLPLDRPKEEWDNLFLMFVTSSGNIRRNPLSDFSNLKNIGKIAMKLEDEGERLISVQICREEDDILLMTKTGRAVRVSASSVREFKSRGSTGVRGVRLNGDDEVIAMTVLGAVGFTPDEARAYVKRSNQLRSAMGDEPIEDSVDTDDEDDNTNSIELSDERFAQLQSSEQFVFLMTSEGFGYRTSAYNFRRMGRGGQGLQTVQLSKRGGSVLAAFAVGHDEHLMAITDAGQVIRFAVSDVSIKGRRTMGIRLFRVDEEETIVSVTCLSAEQVAKTEGETDCDEADITEEATVATVDTPSQKEAS